MASSSFKASDYGTVKYNFKPDVSVEGTIPDPSDEMLQQYHKDMKEVMRESGIDDLPTESELRNNPSKVDEMLDRIDKFDQMELHHRVVKLIATLCQDQPSEDEILGLPYRKRIFFIRYVQKELVNPEA